MISDKADRVVAAANWKKQERKKVANENQNQGLRHHRHRCGRAYRGLHSCQNMDRRAVVRSPGVPRGLYDHALPQGRALVCLLPRLCHVLRPECPRGLPQGWNTKTQGPPSILAAAGNARRADANGSLGDKQESGDIDRSGCAAVSRPDSGGNRQQPLGAAAEAVASNRLQPHRSSVPEGSLLLRLRATLLQFPQRMEPRRHSLDRRRSRRPVSGIGKHQLRAEQARGQFAGYPAPAVSGVTRQHPGCLALLAEGILSTALPERDHLRSDLQGREGSSPRLLPHDRHRAVHCHPDRGWRFQTALQVLPHRLRRPYRRRHSDHGNHPGNRAAVLGDSQPASERAPVYQAQHRVHPQRLQPAEHCGAALFRRRFPLVRGSRVGNERRQTHPYLG